MNYKIQDRWKGLCYAIFTGNERGQDLYVNNYSGYGELIETPGDIENSHMYAGECYDEESELKNISAL